MGHRQGLYAYWLALAVLAAPWPMPGGRALADTFQVTKTLDTRDGKCDADCSLREAIIAANQHPGLDTVMLPAGEYVLQQVGQEDQAAAGDLDILDDLTLIGAGAESTLIDGNRTLTGQGDRVFAIHSPAVVQLTGLTVQNGIKGTGGGIYNDGSLTLQRCTLSGNSAAAGGGIYNSGSLTLQSCTLSGNSSSGRGGGIFNNGGPLTLENCTLSGNFTGSGAADNGGGGIYNNGSLALQSCTLSGNSADLRSGGGIYNDGTATLTNCTLSGNLADYYRGGGIYNGGTLTLENCTLSGNSADTGGGGIYNNGTVTLTNSTLSGNSAGHGGGIYNDGSLLTLQSCTLSGNLAGGDGGGIDNETRGSLTLQNCTLSGNSAGRDGGGIYGGAILQNTIIANSPQGRNCSAPLQSNGHNLDDDGSCGFFNTGDLSFVPTQLAPLGDNGGPTQTHALCTGPGVPHPGCQAASPAIDAGANAHCPATDQRGAPRPHGSACDIGAYESGAEVPMPGSCQGDCGNDAAVTVNEIITMVNIALGSANVSACTAGDADGSGDITINEIIAAVNHALNGCAAG
jgi:CSLREA domain-containing protein